MNTSRLLTAKLFTLIFLAALSALALAGQLPLLLLWIYWGLSLLSFLVYWLDKSAAQRGAWRIEERSLHLLALLGGWPGALMAQQQLRHKSSKPAFLRVFWLTVIINLGGLIWLYVRGQQLLNSLLHQLTSH
jgi:uncharacterized membrane protein YsdA (DUF1294 family)